MPFVITIIHFFDVVQILGKKDILAVLHPGLPEAESASLGNKQRKALGAFSGLGGGPGQEAAAAHIRGG
jgi:hypothetical protein